MCAHRCLHVCLCVSLWLCTPGSVGACACFHVSVCDNVYVGARGDNILSPLPTQGMDRMKIFSSFLSHYTVYKHTALPSQ